MLKIGRFLEKLNVGQKYCIKGFSPFMSIYESDNSANDPNHFTYYIIPLLMNEPYVKIHYKCSARYALSLMKFDFLSVTFESDYWVLTLK